MTTIFLIAFCITAGFVTGLAWRWYEGDVELHGDRLSPLRCVQGTPGTKVVIALPAAFPGIVPAAYKWSAPLINYYYRV